MQQESRDRVGHGRGLAWGMVAGGYRPDRYDVIGGLICLGGVAVIMYAPRS
jgi:small multidrug resistance family-3 protein